MTKRLWFVLLVFGVRESAAELTEEDIIAKELAWATNALRHFHHGFGNTQPLKRETEDDVHWRMLGQTLLKEEDFVTGRQETLNLRGRKKR